MPYNQTNIEGAMKGKGKVRDYYYLQLGTLMQESLLLNHATNVRPDNLNTEITKTLLELVKSCLHSLAFIHEKEVSNLICFNFSPFFLSFFLSLSLPFYLSVRVGSWEIYIDCLINVLLN